MPTSKRPDVSLIDDLNDNSFALATEYIASLSREIEDETGEKPTLEELCDLLAWGLRSCSADILKDADPANVTAVRATLARKGKVVLKPGDLIAIPAEVRSGCYLALFIVTNGFGYAYGLFEGRHNKKPLSRASHLKPLQYPIYSGRAFVANGRWQIIGNYPHLLPLFPSVPELFHSKRDNENNPKIGSFGSGESPNNALRQLSEAEARTLGLLDGSYRQCLLEQEIEALLNRTTAGGHASGAA